MKIHKLHLNGLCLIKYKTFSDKRGFIKKIFEKKNFNIPVLKFAVKNINISSTKKRGTFRGLHFQKKPYMEKKLMTCLSGKIYDFAVNINPKSKDYLKTFSIKISENDNFSIFYSEDFAHGFQSLTNNVLLCYLHSQEYYKNKQGLIKYSDKRINIKLPLKLTYISNKDK